MFHLPPESKQRVAAGFAAYVNALIEDERTHGYSFVIHRDRQIITVSRNRRHITTFGYSWPGVENARRWLTSMCELS